MFRQEETQHTETGSSNEDHLRNYHCAKLTFGLILMEFNDAIKEGDGERLLDVYKVALLIPKANGKSKYAYEVLLYLVKIYGILSRYEAHNMK